MQISKNKIFKYYVSQNKKQEENNEEILENIPDNYSMEEEVFNKFQNEDIWDTTKLLNEVTQKILILYFRENYKIPEISHLLEINESTVKSKLYRGINDLKKSLERNYHETI